MVAVVSDRQIIVMSANGSRISMTSSRTLKSELLKLRASSPIALVISWIVFLPIRRIDRMRKYLELQRVVFDRVTRLSTSSKISATFVDL